MSASPPSPSLTIGVGGSRKGFQNRSMTQSWTSEGLKVGGAYSGCGEVDGFSVRDTTNQFIRGWDTPSRITNWSYYKRGWRSGTKSIPESVWCDLDHVPPSRRQALGLDDPEKAIWATQQILRRREAELDEEHERRLKILAHREHQRGRLASRHMARHMEQHNLGARAPMQHDYGSGLAYVNSGGLLPYRSQGNAQGMRRSPSSGLSSSLSSHALSMEQLETWHRQEPDRPPSQARKTAPELHCEGLRDLPGLPRHPVIVGPAFDRTM